LVVFVEGKRRKREVQRVKSCQLNRREMDLGYVGTKTCKKAQFEKEEEVL